MGAPALGLGLGVAVGGGGAALAAARACSAVSSLSSAGPYGALARPPPWPSPRWCEIAVPALLQRRLASFRSRRALASLTFSGSTSGPVERLALGREHLLRGLYGLAQLVLLCRVSKVGCWASYPRLA